MHCPSKAVIVSVLSVALCMVLSTVAFSIEKEVYDKPDVQKAGRTIHGKVVKVAERDTATHKWDVSVENGETGEVVPLHLDKTTARKETAKNPAVGDKVVVKYDEHSKHAISFVEDTAPSN